MKKTFVLFILAVFTLSIGYAQNDGVKSKPYTKEAKKKKSPAEKADRVIERFSKALVKKEIEPLTETQTANLKATYVEGYAQIKEARANAKANPTMDTMEPKKKGNPAVKEVRKAMNARIKSILTPEQHEAYTNLRKRKKSKGKKGYGKKGGKKGKAMMAPDGEEH